MFAVEAKVRAVAALAINKLFNLGLDPDTGGLWVTLTGGGSAPPPAPATALDDLAPVAVQTTATKLSASATSFPRGIYVQAPRSNTLPVYVGGSGVAAGGAGRILYPGGSWTEPSITDLSLVYAVAASTGQSLNLGGIS